MGPETAGDEESGHLADVMSSITELRYSAKARDLVRFTDDPTDDAIARDVSRILDLSPGRKEELRSRLGEADCYGLITFAKRRTVAALRSKSLPMALESVAALTLVDRSKIDFRDLSVDFPLYAVRELGGSLDEVVARAAASSESGTARSFLAKARRAHTLTLKDCALLEVHSSYGLGYMTRRSASYQPTTRLAEFAVLLADQVDAEGVYEIDDLHIGELPEVWFYKDRRTGHIPTAACVGLSAHLRGVSRFSHGLIIFVAAFGDDTVGPNLAALVDAAGSIDRPRAATARDRRLGVIIGGSDTAGEVAHESRESMSRYAELIGSLFESTSK
jgi:hypothetical protein